MRLVEVRHIKDGRLAPGQRHAHSKIESGGVIGGQDSKDQRARDSRADEGKRASIQLGVLDEASAAPNGHRLQFCGMMIYYVNIDLCKEALGIDQDWFRILRENSSCLAIRTG